MKAIVLREFGDIDKLVYEDYPTPTVGVNDVLVAVKACGVNRLDLWIRSGTHPLQISVPHIVGAEIAGEVAEVGKGIEHLRVGQRVAIAPYLFCGHCEFCLSGHEESCEKIRIIGREIDGGYAEYVRAPAANIVELPTGMSFSEAAGVTLAMLTAWHMLVSRAEIRAGEIVLVLAAGSGVGSAAIQIAKLSGCRVIATSSRDEHLERARDLGANDLINYQETDFLVEVMELTEGRGVDVVFEHVGAATWEKSLGCLARNGRLVTCGATSGGEGKVNIWALFGRQQSILGSYGGTRAELQTVLGLVAEGRLRPVIHREYPLTQAPKAHRELESRLQFGKILLTV